MMVEMNGDLKWKADEAIDEAYRRGYEDAKKEFKCENCKILELLIGFELETICEDDGKDFEYCENNCDFKAPTKECYLHWADMRKESHEV